MEQLRTPFLIAAMISIFLAFFLEIGNPALASFLSDFFESETLTQAFRKEAPPGLAISYIALFDSLLIFTISLIVISLLIPGAIHARIQGIATLIVALLVIIACITLITHAISKLVVMVSLLLAPVFGTIAYFGLFSDFPTISSRIILSTMMTLKFAFAAFLIFAHQKFLQNYSLVMLVLFTFLLGMLVNFFHAIVPEFLVSITDAIAAIIVALIALVWAVMYLFGGFQSVSRALK